MEQRRKFFIGKEETARSQKIFSLDLPATSGDYRFYTKNAEKIFSAVLPAIVKILAGEGKANNYETLVKALHVVHHVSTEHRKSKLDGINSLSTCCLDNVFCIARMKDPESICSHCYASTQQKSQGPLASLNTINGIILRNVIIPVKYFKKYFSRENLSKFFRFESFGDVQNITQCINYINLAKAFPRLNFAVWTKNSNVWTKAFLQEGKPENLVYIVSSNKVNKREEVKSGYIDHTFTVYDKKAIAKNAIRINCGGKVCKECIKRKVNCYFHNTEKDIREGLK